MFEAIQGVDGDPIVYVNGDHVPLSKAGISVLDRGFIFGDGIYEVVPVYWQQPFRMQEHLDRLDRSLAKIEIAQPFTREQWQHLIVDLLAAQPKRDHAMVYIQVTRGVAKRDHAFPNPPVKPTVFAMVAPMTPPGDSLRSQGVRAVSMEDMRWLHCDIKSVSLLGNVLAKQAAIKAGVDEVIQFRSDILTEGAACNVWMVEGGKVYGAPKDNRVLEGIRYGLFQELCERCGLDFVLEPVSRDRVIRADELMVSSATREVLPVVELDGKPIGQGKPGPVYGRLRQAYDDCLSALRGLEVSS
ncbi:D-amino acid aminotransferase [Orrella daihaiensis]|uniref:D-amino acid aminotransferase n=1 Tax=Orrella daihaiensis TaxID=2782176 RepID=A0ABY4AJA1_9BURK|nr:D-amino acid aminotransferase [Orrella daihaiensis]UOD50352.1 D-amino acid aminotransferase [Orrella daihaiensis]